MFEAVQILKGGYKAGTILAAAEVEALEAGAGSSMDLNVASDSSMPFNCNVVCYVCVVVEICKKKIVSKPSEPGLNPDQTCRNHFMRFWLRFHIYPELDRWFGFQFWQKLLKPDQTGLRQHYIIHILINLSRSK
jgi:hypothetical protein